jgi:hypothetical protein
MATTQRRPAAATGGGGITIKRAQWDKFNNMVAGLQQYVHTLGGGTLAAGQITQQRNRTQQKGRARPQQQQRTGAVV